MLKQYQQKIIEHVQLFTFLIFPLSFSFFHVFMGISDIFMFCARTYVCLIVTSITTLSLIISMALTLYCARNNVNITKRPVKFYILL
jgi:hypothetical protein